MTKVTKFYIDQAKYRVEDSEGRIIWVKVNYWENKFKISENSVQLEKVAKDLLRRKHKVNFAEKLLK